MENERQLVILSYIILGGEKSGGVSRHNILIFL